MLAEGPVNIELSIFELSLQAHNIDPIQMWLVHAKVNCYRVTFQISVHCAADDLGDFLPIHFTKVLVFFNRWFRQFCSHLVRNQSCFFENFTYFEKLGTRHRRARRRRLRKMVSKVLISANSLWLCIFCSCKRFVARIFKDSFIHNIFTWFDYTDFWQLSNRYTF